ncbi:hypothetical protein FRX31_008954 [Thalictrum thalictroides]|uniref:Uncharacterized protein n=1 Tax=Thalictrum thalictroides TaxID=46969 RepID=A0A7J6WYB3_THATH|nr:hypothetical protein FRX31_008954 [Thalictrum thalictroides]
MKATWSIITSDSLWATFMRVKYIQGKTSSKTWKECWRCLRELVEHSTWDFGVGNFNVFQENWRGSGNLAHIVVPHPYQSFTLEEAAIERFNFPILHQGLQQELLEDLSI